MASPQVADGGEGLPIWKLAANIMNKQLLTGDKGCPSGFGVGRGAKIILLRNVTKSLGLGRILWINDLSYGK
jgi:hypothetical protein